MSHTVVCFGPGPIFKGGLSNYNTSLAKAMAKQPNTKVYIVSWNEQYPSIIPRDFKDKSSKLNFLEGTDIQCEYITNFNNPFSWKKTVNFIAKLNPDKVIFQWSIALQGLPLRSILKGLKKYPNIELIMDLHFVIQKEKSAIDKFFTKYCLPQAHTYIVHALKTFQELQTVFPKQKYLLTETGTRQFGNNNVEKAVIKLYHPIYDLFQPNPNLDIEAFKEEHKLKKYVFLFFGFIRKYKGLHQAIEAFKIVCQKRDDVSLIIAGESFWNTLDNKSWTTKIKQFLFGIAKRLFLNNSDDEQNYNPLQLIDKYNLNDNCVVFNRFIPNEEVPPLFQVSDCVVLYYLTATPSGVESLSYNFNLPILATKVGHFPETVIDGFNGYLAEDKDVESMAKQMFRYLEEPISPQNVAKTSERLSWNNYAKAILGTL